MTSQMHRVNIYSDHDVPGVSAALSIQLVGDNPSCPIVLLNDADEPVFAITNEEIPDLIEILKKFSLM